MIKCYGDRITDLRDIRCLLDRTIRQSLDFEHVLHEIDTPDTDVDAMVTRFIDRRVDIMKRGLERI